MINLDRYKIDIPCPKCGFYNSIVFRQARLLDVIICGGCKINIRLDDQMNECRKAVRSFRQALQDLEKTLSSLSFELKP